jgi:hypothetical protein
MARYDDNESIHSDSELYRRGDVNSRHILNLRRKLILGFWMNPTFLNGWFTFLTDLQEYQYRLIFDDTFQDKGTIDGGASGSIAYIVPELWRPLSRKNIRWVGSSAVTSLVFAEFEMNGITGEVKVTF